MRALFPLVETFILVGGLNQSKMLIFFFELGVPVDFVLPEPTEKRPSI